MGGEPAHPPLASPVGGLGSETMTSSDPTDPGRPFTGMELDRVSVERKQPDWVARLATRPSTRGIAAGRDGVLVSASGDGLARISPTQEQLSDLILLGVDGDGAGLFAVDLDHETAAERIADDGSWDAGREESAPRIVSLRDAGVELSHAEAGLAAYATALLNWHRRHSFCANCGASTFIVEGGYSRHCPQCGTHHFPRTDPVVIMTVEHDGRLLLGRRSGWPEGRLSVLAGFVSPGESAEEAVIREVQEESGIVARDATFVTSQPWPFPASLMLGFHAESDGGTPRATDGELEEVHWMDYDDVRRAVEGQDAPFQLPGTVSIARFLIERWVATRGAST
jgi:NAD+ diphosphatase